MSGMELLLQAAARRSEGAAAAGREDAVTGQASANGASGNGDEDRRRFLLSLLADGQSASAVNGNVPIPSVPVAAESSASLPPKKRRKLRSAASLPSVASVVSASSSSCAAAALSRPAPPVAGLTSVVTSSTPALLRPPLRPASHPTRNSEWTTVGGVPLGQGSGGGIWTAAGGVPRLPGVRVQEMSSSDLLRLMTAARRPLQFRHPPALKPRQRGAGRQPGTCGAGQGGKATAPAPDLAPLTDVNGAEIRMGYFSRK